MRSVGGIRGLLAVGAAALLTAVVGIGCRDHQASGHEPPGRPEPVARIVEDVLLPGDRTLPGGAPTVTTAVPSAPIGRTSSPVPTNRTPLTRPPLVLPRVETTTTTTGPLSQS
jgi:hypothetical protein